MTDKNDNPLENRHIVITGGGRGIGAVLADEFAKQGARLTLMGRERMVIEKKCAGLKNARAVSVDVTDSDSVRQAFLAAQETFGPVEVLINNAGAAASSPLLSTDNETWSNMLAVNLTGVFYCTREVLPEMKRANWGRIITIASTAGVRGYAYVSAYSAAKHGVIGLTRSLALEMAQTGITVNAICPGYTRTDLLEQSIDNIMKKTGMDREQTEKTLKAGNPQQRFIEPGEIAAAAVWLCRPGSESITGQSLLIAGGEVM